MIKSILNPPASIGVGLAIGAVDLAVFSQHVPNFADIRSAQPHNTDVETGRRQATVMCVAVNGLVSLMCRDWNVFLIGGVVTVGLSFLSVHANAVNPATGKMTAAGGESVDSGAAVYNLPDYGDAS